MAERIVTPNADATLALLALGSRVRELHTALFEAECKWDGMDLGRDVYDQVPDLRKQIPTMPATLSLRTRLAALDKALTDAVRITRSLCASLNVSIETFPLPDELPPDDREEEA